MDSLSQVQLVLMLQIEFHVVELWCDGFLPRTYLNMPHCDRSCPKIGDTCVRIECEKHSVQ